MGPTKVLAAKEGDDIKKSLFFFVLFFLSEVSVVKMQQRPILVLMEEVKAEKDRRLADLERRVEKLDHPPLQDKWFDRDWAPNQIPYKTDKTNLVEE